MNPNRLNSMPNVSRLELLGPDEIEARLATASLIYLPCGPIEWHGYHLPVGLDGLVAHGVCERAAAKTGGLVMPTFWMGTGGGHSQYPWTAMFPCDLVDPAMRFLITAMSRWRPRIIVLFSGHFSDEQRNLGHALAKVLSNEACEVLSLTPLAWANSPIKADHAGLFETLLLGAIRPDLVHLEKLPESRLVNESDPYGFQRHDPAHPLYGIFGADPCSFTPETSIRLLDGLVEWLVETVKTNLKNSPGSI